MKKFLLFLIPLNAVFFHAVAQIQPYGTIDTADLKMTSCDFEKDANAEVLFDHAVVTYEFTSVVEERHRRIKIFNDNGKKEANIRIEFFGKNRDEVIKDIDAETINLNGKTIEYTAIDKKLIYTETINKYRKAVIFTFPNVRAGSVLEFKYKLIADSPYDYPDWDFQSTIPTRYSEFNGSFTKNYLLDSYKQVYQPMVNDTSIKIDFNSGTQRIWALSNIKSYRVEPYMDYPADYHQRLSFRKNYRDSKWDKICSGMMSDIDFGQQTDDRLSNADTIIGKAKTLKTDEEKIAYIFKVVKKSMKWNKVDYWFTVDGVKKAWDKKTGNSTEINLILYNLLRSAKVDVSLLALVTRNHGRIDPDYPSVANLNRTVLYYAVDAAKYYVLDATSPFNTYNNIPLDLIGQKVLRIDPNPRKFIIFPIGNGSAKETVTIDGEISADGKLVGLTKISSSAYSRAKYLKRYNELGEKNYIGQMQDENSGLKITSLKLENIENDTLPLIQDFNISYNLTEPDGDYMYFNPNVFSGFKTNPFLSENRVSNIDFGCIYNYTIIGRYKIPSGYKTNVLPKSVILQMPDDGIVFRRFVTEQDGTINIRYTINYKRSAFSKDEYASLKNFYKKMYEMLNEQVVLKKSG